MSMELGEASSPVPGMSTNLSSQGEDYSVYVRLVNKKDQLEWYKFSVFNRAADGDGRKRGLKGFGDYLPEPTPLKGKKISRFSRCVAVGSTIYCIGGRKISSSSGRSVVDNSVFCLNTSRPEHQLFWVQAPSMLCPRSKPDTVVVNGKIFVMGGTTEDCTEPWAEVFDPESGSWNPLPPPPFRKSPSDFNLFCAALFDSDLVLVRCKEGDCVSSAPYKPPSNTNLFYAAALHDSDLISVGSQGDDYLFYTYNVHTKVWDTHHGKLENIPFPVQPISVGSTLFWFHNSELHAYDIIEKWHCSGPVKCLDENTVLLDHVEQISGIKPVLLHLGGDQFCWIYFEKTGYYLTLLHYVQFRLSSSPGARLTAFAESCQSYLINSPSLLLDAVLI
ncbi:hypothetical protein RHMOL_Rhmol09G0266500 [Rhododendron molle]|uniref:Uncharacterized protein n=1 Tax=Rhododendron molle TaxID=49168 RepID=A0ACC0MHL2_RHOML|nr:hypothetical protein RHMOL_Rhmol09G0266500 [Rhododendron molle]